MEIKEIKLDLLYGKSFEDLWQNHSDECFEHVSNLLEKKFTISDSDIEHRTALHWEKEGLISRGESNEKWRRYSFFDYVWLRTIKELREFGVSIPIIQEIKSQIFHSHAENIINEISDNELELIRGKVLDQKQMTREKLKEEARQNPLTSAFNAAIFQTIYTRTPTYLIIYSNGVSGILMMNGLSMEEKVNILMDTIQKENTLFINISNIIEQFFESEKFSGNTYFKLSPLSRKEKEIIEILKSEGVNSVNINFKNGNEVHLEIKRKYASKGDIDEIERIIAKHKFATIEIKIENRKPISYVLNEKKIFK